ncbi:MAG: S-layer homology domain-containing protein [Oscillospiraceae bacterium]|nr:S-layer homology domain-containing protein [Oscillospiraceae bacterium]
MTKAVLTFALCLSILPSFSVPSSAVSDAALDEAIRDTAEYVYRTIKSPQVGSVGGEWAVMELARSGYDVPETYYGDYYAAVEEYVEACGGVLHNKKYTEYSRVILALTAIGKDPSDVAGYNLLTPLGDYEKTIWQGLNGPIWALISLDTGNYEIPHNPDAATQATRDMYIDRILECQLPDGGFSLFGGTSSAPAASSADPDITGMALQALAKYQHRADVKRVTEEALAVMSEKQDDGGGYSSWGTSNSESVVQMIVALCELGIPLDDPRFVKKGGSLLDNLMTYYLPGSGFSHTASGDGNNQMATEQALYALIAVQRARDGMPSLYRMTDALKTTGGGAAAGPGRGTGLPGKHADVRQVPITSPGAEFDDMYAHKNLMAVNALAARGIIEGVGDDSKFAPDATMTRAQFAAIVTRGLGLPEKTASVFDDVPASEWYAKPVATAYFYEIINGFSATTFNPGGTIKRQEAAAMIARAAALCGMDTDMEPAQTRGALSQFDDYVKCADWAREYLAFCYREEIMTSDGMDIRPLDNILRAEVAQMLFNLLDAANLL